MSEELSEQDKGRKGPAPRRQNSMLDPRGSLRGARTQSIYSEAPSNYSEDRRDLLDLQSMTYAELKSTTLENILALEKPSVSPQYRVSRHNNYQEILNALQAEHCGQLNVVRSSDEVGVFHLEGSSGSMMLPGASANLLLDDLLQAQYDNKNSITVFEEAGGGAKLAVNLLLHLVFKKFYRDE